MKRFVVLASALCLLIGGCGRQPADRGSKTEPAPATTSPAELGDFVIGEPLRYENLTIFPVASKVPKNDDRYITLEEGLKAGTVEVCEVGAARGENAADAEVPAQQGEATAEPESQDPVAEDVAQNAAGQEQETIGQGQGPDEAPADPFAAEDGGQEVAGDVNRLMIVNRSEKPLYLMPGEVIYGGKQDRTIAQETIILADAKPVAVDVYCVEQGRWHGRALAETAQGYVLLSDGAGEQVDQETLDELAAEANRGKFVAKAGNLSKSSRLAVQLGKGQQAVWEDVGMANAAADLNVASGTFTANYSSEEVAERLKPYLDKLEAPVAGHRQVVGALVSINGKVEAVDVFNSTPLFRKLWPKLLKSHALDAANAADAPEAKKICTQTHAASFFADAMQAEVKQQADAAGGLVVTRRESNGVVSFSAAEAPADEDALPPRRVGFGGAVHSAGYAQ